MNRNWKLATDIRSGDTLRAYKAQSYRSTLRDPATSFVLEYDTLRLVPALGVSPTAQTRPGFRGVS